MRTILEHCIEEGAKGRRKDETGELRTRGFIYSKALERRAAIWGLIVISDTVLVVD